MDRTDSNLTRITTVLKLMDKGLGSTASVISSRAVAVSAYLFVEELHINQREDQVSQFCRFYVDLLNEIKRIWIS